MNKSNCYLNTPLRLAEDDPLLILENTEDPDNQLILKGMATLVISVLHPAESGGDQDHILLYTT